MSEALYEQRPLGDAVERHIGGGTPPRQVPSYWKGYIPWASVKDFPEQKGVIQDTEEHISSAGLHASASNLIPEQTPLVCTRMAVGRAALPVIPMAINQDVKALFPASGVSAGYLLKLMQYIQPLAEGRAVGSTVKGIRIQDYLNITVPMAPQKAQPVIAQVLDTLDTTIRETEVLIDKLKAVKQGLLHDLLTRGIDANGQLRPPQSEAPQLYKKSPLGRIPREWEVVSISDLATNLDGRRIPIKEGFRKAGEIPYYGASGVIDWVDSYIFDGDYVLLGEDGENVVSRRLPLAFRASGKIWVNNHAHIYEPNPGVDIRFLVELMEAKDYSPWVSGSAQPKITQEALARLLFVKPSSDEQAAIGVRLEKLNNRIDMETVQLAKLQRSKAGLMNDLLTGRVRVTPLLESVQQAAAQTGA